MIWKKKSVDSTLEISPTVDVVIFTPPIAEIIWFKNVRAIVVCGFSIESLKKYSENLIKIVGAIGKLPAK